MFSQLNHILTSSSRDMQIILLFIYDCPNLHKQKIHVDLKGYKRWSLEYDGVDACSPKYHYPRAMEFD